CNDRRARSAARNLAAGDPGPPRNTRIRPTPAPAHPTAHRRGRARGCPSGACGAWPPALYGCLLPCAEPSAPTQGDHRAAPRWGLLHTGSMTNPISLPDREIPPFDQLRAEAAVRELLYAVGEDPERDGLRDTPARVARMYAEVFAGMRQSPEEVLTTTFDLAHDELV